MFQLRPIVWLAKFTAILIGIVSLLPIIAVGSTNMLLTVSKVNNGKIISLPPGIDCGTTCSAYFISGTDVMLQAVPETGSVFTGWSNRYDDNNDGTITDNTTGLMWMRCAIGQVWNGGICSGTANTYTWDQANALTSTFAGHNDWQLPNIRKLQTIVNRAKFAPATDTITFPSIPLSNFWSASVNANNTSKAWVVDFNSGKIDNGTDKTSVWQVRLVREGLIPALLTDSRPNADYVNYEDGTVIHNPTGLMWKRCSEGQTWTNNACSGTAGSYTHAQAKNLVLTSSFAGHSDWHLPNEEELISLVDYTLPSPGPTINTTNFPATPVTLPYWSSSDYINDTVKKWYVSFGSGIANIDSNDKTLQVRLVRNALVQPLKAIPSCTPLSGSAPLQVTFKGRGEFAGGSIVQYSWDLDNNGTYEINDSVPINHQKTFYTMGNYIATLQVKNNLGNTATASCTIVVTGVAPTVIASVTPSNGPVPLDVLFRCTASSQNGTIALYEWDFDGDGVFDYSSATTGDIQHTYAAVGAYSAKCRVTDTAGLSDISAPIDTLVRSRPPGSPTVIANANPIDGRAPLNVSFSGSAVDDGTITNWKWDFDGDGTYDYSSATSASTSHTYSEFGTFSANLQATDNVGLTSTDSIGIKVTLDASLQIAKDTFNTDRAESTTIATNISGNAHVRILLRNAAGSVVRTLVNADRQANNYQDAWDGKDDVGNFLPQGVYYAILEYTNGSDVVTVDLTQTTGGDRYTPSRSGFPSTFNPYENNQLPITFTLSEASEVLAFVGLFSTDTRFRTILDNEVFGAGTYTVYWDGLTSDGKFAVPPTGDSFLFGMFGYTLPSNAIYIQSSPNIAKVVSDRTFFGVRPGMGVDEYLSLTFDLDEKADIEFAAVNLATGTTLRTIRQTGVTPNTGLTVKWDGLADNGMAADTGDYRLSLKATDQHGNASITRFVLIKVFH